MTTNEKPIYKIREFLKPTWKKQILFLISYFYLGGILFHLFVEGKFLGIAYLFLAHLFVGGIFLGIAYQFLVFFLLYFVSCLATWIIFKSDKLRKLTFWEIGMFIGIVAGCSNPLGIPAGLLFFQLLEPVSKYLIPDFLIYPKAEGRMWWSVMVSPVIAGAIIGFLVSYIIHFGKKSANNIKYWLSLYEN